MDDQTPLSSREQTAVPSWCRFCAILLAVGALTLLILVVLLVVQSPQAALSGLMMAVMAIGLAFLARGLWSAQGWAWPWAILVFAMQVPVLLIDNLVYYFVTGFGFFIAYATGGEIHLLLKFGGLFQLILGNPVPEKSVGLNVVAIVCLVGLLRARKTTQVVSAEEASR